MNNNSNQTENKMNIQNSKQTKLQEKQQFQQTEKQQQFDHHSEKYFQKLLLINGKHMASFQTSHVMVLYFVIQGLAVNNSLQKSLKVVTKEKIVEYVKNLELPRGGFGPSSLYTNFQTDHRFNLPHIVFTYSAVNILKILGKLDVIDKDKCLASVGRCMKENGSFSNFQNSNQADLRFVYAAVAISNAFNDFSYNNKEKIKSYIDSCYNFDGGYGLRPYCQSHSGAIYCAIASYKILGYEIPNKDETLEFLVNRQSMNEQKKIVGVQGRVGKLPDSCYTFWVGAAIKFITGQNLLDENIQNFLTLCYNSDSFNFSKYPKMKGDPLHTLHSNVGLRIIKKNDSGIDILQGTTNIGQI